MRRLRRLAWVLAVLSAAPAPASALGQDASRPAPGRILGTHQIDRYEAIRQLRATLQANPNALNDWIMLGELAQEVAHDVPADLAPGYYRLARESYEAAEKLAPTNASLKAAAQFAREQEQGAERFAEARRKAATTYLSARRRELAQPGAGPTLRVYATPAPAPAGGAAAPSPYYYYQPYVAGPGRPFTYQQYSRSYVPMQGEAGPIEPRAGQTITATERAALVKPASGFAPP